MVDDPRDRRAYQIAIAALGFALAVAIASIAWVATGHENTVLYKVVDPAHLHWKAVYVHKVSPVPLELWLVAGFLGGVFIGALIPFSGYTDIQNACSRTIQRRKGLPFAFGFIVGAVAVAVVCVVAILLGQKAHWSPPLDLFGATVVGVLLGLAVPSPSRVDRQRARGAPV